MTTARAGDPGAAAVEAPGAATPPAAPPAPPPPADVDIDLTVDLPAVRPADPPAVRPADLAPSPLDAAPEVGLAPPRLPQRLSALLVLLVLPVAVVLTVAAMTLMLPSGDADRSGTASAAMSKVRVSVLDGSGDPALVREVAQRLAAADIAVVAGGQAAGGPFERTEVVYHDPAARMAAAEVRRVLRVGKVILDPSLTGATEVSVIVGKDFRFS